MKTIAWIGIFCCCFVPGFSQIETVRVGVNGLTCSQCTRSVEKKLRQLPFVADVSMNLANTSGEIRLKQGVAFRPEAISRAVRDAGFSLRFVHLLLQNPAEHPASGNCLSVSGLNLQLVGELPPPTAKTWELELLGTAFGGKRQLPAKAGCQGLQVTAVGG